MDFYDAMVSHYNLATEIQGEDEEAMAERESHLNLAMIHAQMVQAESLYLLARQFSDEFEPAEDPEDKIAEPLYDVDGEEVLAIIKELRAGSPAHVMASEVLYRAFSTLEDTPE